MFAKNVVLTMMEKTQEEGAITKELVREVESVLLSLYNCKVTLRYMKYTTCKPRFTSL